MIEYQAACYGKLPFHGDFIRHQAGGAEYQWLDRWIQEGIVSLGESFPGSWGEVFQSSSPMRFLIQIEKSSIAGVSRPSVDSAGRRFPFLVFCVLDSRQIRKRPSGIPLAMEEFLTQAEALLCRDFSGVGLPGLTQSIDALSSAIDWKLVEQNLDAALTNFGIGELWQALFGSQSDDRRYIFASNAADLLGPKSSPRFPLELPFAASPYHLSTWMEFAAQARGRDRIPVAWSWRTSSSGRTPLLRATVGSPEPTHYLPLFYPDTTCEDLCKLAEEGLDQTSFLESARTRFAPLVDDLSLPLAKFIAGLAKMQR